MPERKTTQARRVVRLRASRGLSPLGVGALVMAGGLGGVVAWPESVPGAGGAFELSARLGVIATLAGLGVARQVRAGRAKESAGPAVRSGLMAYAAGEQPGDGLRIGGELDELAGAWNKLVDEASAGRELGSVRALLSSLGGRGGEPSVQREALDAVPFGVVLVDRGGSIESANASAVGMLRLPVQCVGRGLSELSMPGELCEAAGEVLSGSARRRVVVLEPEASGGSVLRVTVRRAGEAERSLAVLAVEDITQQRAAEEARNSFVAQATHELRTPLTNIRLYVEEAIEEGDRDPALRQRALDVINQESRRLERVVADMLSVAEIEAGAIAIRVGEVNLEQMFRELEEDYKPQAFEKQQALVFERPPKYPVAQADREKLSLALHNLIGNAIKYTPKGGTVTVRIEPSESELVVDVIDTGIGIAPADQERVFEKFYRAQDERVSAITGSGLGLALAREVVRLHGGDVTLESVLNQGSTFTLRLPIRPAMRLAA